MRMFLWCQGMAPRSQSSRDVMRQEAKLQEMSEEVRRRELRLTSPQGRVQVSKKLHFPGHMVLSKTTNYDLLFINSI